MPPYEAFDDSIRGMFTACRPRRLPTSTATDDRYVREAAGVVTIADTPGIRDRYGTQCRRRVNTDPGVAPEF